MSLYYRNLKKIGICMILVSIGNLVYELLLQPYLIGIRSGYASQIPLPWGIWTKNIIGVLAGVTALLFYRKKKNYRTGTIILFLLCAAEAGTIILSMSGTIGKRTNGLIDITMLMMVLLTYTISQTDRDLKRWMHVSRRDPVMLDLLLQNSADFFDPIQIGPKMAINKIYASAIKRYIASVKNTAPLQINLYCRQPVSVSLQEMMREVLSMHYDVEEGRIVKVLEKKYRQIMLLISVSIFAMGIVRQFMLMDDELMIWDIIGNFAAFGLWQIGYTHYERNEAYDELLLIHVARNSTLCFIERPDTGTKQ